LAKVSAPGVIVHLRIDAAEVFAPDDVIGGIDGAVAIEVAFKVRDQPRHEARAANISGARRVAETGTIDAVGA
jgi:hypothetical protein